MKHLFSLTVVFLFVQVLAAAEETPIQPSNFGDWIFSDKTGNIKNGELVFDGTSAMSKAFYLPLEWGDVKLSAKYMVEPGHDGQVLACGFVIKAADAHHYYYAHFDRRSAILLRCNEADTWIEIKRIAVPNREAGKWYDAVLEIQGNMLSVYFDGKKLYDAQDNNLTKPGRIGFYANQGIAHIKDIVVSGKATKAVSAMTIPKPLWIHVCTDAGAGAYEAFPDVCRLNDGRLLSVFYAGYTHISVPNDTLPKGGRIAACYSSDEGRTWTPAETIADTPVDDRDPSVVQLADGRILCTFFTYEPQNGKEPRVITYLTESADNGKTWSEPRKLFEQRPVSSPIRVLSGGTLIMPLYGEMEKSAGGYVSISKDNGKNWSEPTAIPNGGHRLDAETDIIELKDGTLYAIQRPLMAYSVSKDKGKTWSVSEPVGFEGHCPYLLRTKNDTILLATRIPKTNLYISRDECKTWGETISVDDFIGAYPSMVELKDGTILIVYYEEGAGSSIRAKRFRVKDGENAVDWLPLD